MIRMVVTMVTVPGTNEQASANLHQFGSGVTLSREFRELAAFRKGQFWLDVNAVSGTNPTLDAVVQVQDPISQKWFTIVTFAQQTGVTNAVVPITPQVVDIDGTNYRAQFTVGGTATPTVTCSMTCVASCEETIV